MALLTVENLSMMDRQTEKKILHNVSFTVYENDFLGIVGESGSGKTSLMKEILRVNAPSIQTSGHIKFLNETITDTTINHIRGRKITMILQDGMTAFNPLKKMGWQMMITFQQLLGVSKNKARELSIDILTKLHFTNPSEILNSYPHELSGGMLQRCMVAIALVIKPQIIVADEPTTALDPISQLEMVKELERIRDTNEISFILASHDLGVIQRLAKRVIVMKDGEIVESGTVDQIFNRPKATYTQQLVNARMKMARENKKYSWGSNSQ